MVPETRKLTEDWGGDGGPDDETLVRLMRYEDGELSAVERWEVERELERDPRSRSYLSDIVRGTEVARRAYGGRGERNVRVFPATGRRVPTRARSGTSSVYMQAAAIVVGIGIGVLGTRAIFEQQNQNSDSGLRLAGAPSTNTTEGDNEQKLAQALVPLLSGAASQVPLEDEAGLHGYVRVMQHLTLSSGVPCIEFGIATDKAKPARLSGLACQSPDGGWQTMTIEPKR